jgi:hypothetical protein
MRFKEALTTFSGTLIFALAVFNNPWLSLFGYLYGVTLIIFSFRTLEDFASRFKKFKR